MTISNENVGNVSFAGVPALDPVALLTTRQVSALWGLAEITLRVWRLKGDGPRFLKLGRNVRYRRGDIEAWLQARSVASTSEPLP